MKHKIIIIIALLTVFSISMQAQTPAFREKGFKGSVGISSGFNDFAGAVIPLSNGYMFNEHHYLGGGIGMYMSRWGHPLNILVEYFIEYECYFLKKSSTPMAGVKTSIKDIFWDQFYPSVEITGGWSWGVGNYGLNLTAGFITYCGLSYTMPKIDHLNFRPTVQFSFNF